MSRRLSAQSCPQVHRRDLSKNPTACGPCGQPSLLTTNTVAALWHHQIVALRESSAGMPVRQLYFWLPSSMSSRSEEQTWCLLFPSAHTDDARKKIVSTLVRSIAPCQAREQKQRGRSGPEPFDEPWPRSNSTFHQNYLAAFVFRVRAAFLSCEAEP